jgi:hypothetical protein
MSNDAVDATAEIALQGLYLTPDIWFSASYHTSSILHNVVDKMHEKQPLTTDYEIFSEKADVAYHLLGYATTPADPPTSADRDEGIRLIDLMMMAADLSITYGQINRAMHAAADLASTILLRSINAEDDAKYHRAIPAALDDLSIPDIEHVNVEIFHRILTVEPWVSWMERLRAQKQRTTRALLLDNAGDHLVDGITEIYQDRKTAPDYRAELRNLWKRNRAAHKSIRKSTDLFDRILGVEARRNFLHSWKSQPLHIEGHRYNYRLYLRPDSLMKTTLNTDTRLATVGTVMFDKAGERLAEICHYFHDTPALDCVISTALNVRNEETELDLLRAACVIDAPRSFYRDPILPELKGLNDPATAPTLIENVFSHAGSLSPGQTALRDTMRTDGTPLAYAAFKNINHLNSTYLPLMKLCERCNMWSYFEGAEETKHLLKLVQRNLNLGKF